MGFSLVPNFKIIDDIKDIKLNNSWVDSTKFNSKDRIVDEKGQTVSSEYQGRRFRLVTKKERLFSSFERFGRGLLGVLAVAASLGLALFSKSIHKLFSDSKKKIYFGKVAANEEEYGKDYDLNYAVSKVKQLSEEVFKRKEKLCLFIGRKPGEPFPGLGQEKPENEIWVSLDNHKNINYDKKFIPNKQLHLLMDMNDNESLKKLYKLFDKVVVDNSTLKFHKENGVKTWYSLGKLLRPQRESQLITETLNFCVYPIEEIKKLMPAEDRNKPLYILGGLESYNEAKIRWLKDREESILDKIRTDGYFSDIVLESVSPFPYMYHTHISNPSHFILTGPQSNLWSQNTKSQSSKSN